MNVVVLAKEARFVRLADTCLAVVAVALVATVGMAVGGHASIAGDAIWVAGFAGFAGVGWFIAHRLPKHAVAWLLIGSGLCVVVASAADTAAAVTGAATTSALLPRLLRWFQELLWIPPVAVLGCFLPLLFPTGRLPSARWRPIAWAGLAVTLLVMGAAALRPGAIGEDAPVVNPFGVRALAGLIAAVDSVGFPLMAALSVAALCSMLGRYHRGDAVERAQLRWIAFAAALVAGFLFLPSAAVELDVLPEQAWASALGGVGLLLLPVAIGVAVVRHRLFDIDILINRALVATIAGSVLAGVYIAVVVASRELVGLDRPGAGPLLASGAVVVVSQPLVHRVRAAVDRRLFGHRNDPYRVVRELAARVAEAPSGAGELDDIVDAVANALKLPWVAIFTAADRAVTETGRLVGERENFVMRYRGKAVGTLAVSNRSPSDRLSPDERRLLQNVANQIAVAVSAASMTLEVQRARERLVEALESDRRRIRRDLHDGLGPALAGVALQLHGGLTRMRNGGELQELEVALCRAIAELETCTADVRRLVEGLRPPALDDLGIVGALEHRAAVLSGDCRVEIVASSVTDDLPAAVEVAAYYIATEAMTNASRHADAACCTVSLELDGSDLRLVVRDNGRGFDTTVPARGIGRVSMRERATELGGTFEIDSRPGAGTTVNVRLPVRAA